VYKQWSIFIVITVLVLALLLTACGTQTTTTPSTTTTNPTTTTSTPSSTTTNQTTTAVNPITLKFGYPMPRTDFAIAYENSFNSMLAKTNGRLKIEYYPAGTLYQIQDAAQATTTGITDIGIIAPEVLSKMFPLTMVCALPDLKFPSTLEGQLAESKALLALGAKYPALQNEWKNFKVLWYMSSPGHVIFSTKKEIVVPADLKGLKLGGIGNDLAMAQVVGAAAVVTPPPLSYQNMKTGVIEACSMNYDSGYESRIYEVTKFVNEYSFGGAGFLVVMNLDTWSKISAADQKIIMDSVDEINNAVLTVHFAGADQMMVELAKVGAKIDKPGVEWNGIAAPVWTSWETDAKAAGFANPEDMLNSWKQMRDDFVNKKITP
jgi:TRAP-type C4-dicarboxylate transport system substrate-binding protein